MFRLHIDIPLSQYDSEAAIQASNIMRFIECNKILLQENGVHLVNYRLGHDEDRQRSNHLDKTPNGHVSNKKSKIEL